MKKAFVIIAVAGMLLATLIISAESAANSGDPGQEVDLKQYLRRDLTNIVDFYSEYCPPCRQISPLLASLDRKRSDIVVVKLDINRKDVEGIDWQSPLARQYGLRSIPHFKIFDGEGNLVKEGEEAFQQVMTWLEEEGLLKRPQ